MSVQTSSHLTKGQVIGLVAALFTLLCFFLPWIELNLLIATASLSGYQLAAGSGPAGASFPGATSLFLVPFSMMAVAGLILARLFGKEAMAQLQKISAPVLIAAGCLSVAVLLYQYFNLNEQFSKDVFGLVAQKIFSYTFGAGASLFGSMAVLVAGLLDLSATTRLPHVDDRLR